MQRIEVKGIVIGVYNCYKRQFLTTLAYLTFRLVDT